MEKEMSSLKKNHTWELVDQQSGQKPIKAARSCIRLKKGLKAFRNLGVASSNNVRRPEFEDTNSKKIVLLNTKSKNTSTNVKKVNRALFTSPVATKSRNLGATSIVAKSKFNVAKTPIATNKNGVVERRNHTLVEAACTMLTFSKSPEYIWTEAIATDCESFTQIRSIIYTRYNKTPYELIKGRKPNVQYFHVFGSLCYPTNDCDELRKMKLKADIRIFIGPGFNCLNFQDSSEDTNCIPLKGDLDNLFVPLYEEYYAMRTPKVSKKSAANTIYNEDTPSSSSIVVEENKASQIVTSSEEPVANEPTTLVSNANANESIQEDVAAFNENNFSNPFHTPVFEEAESSLTF
ncbi:retrovirus-related pol polyprotein from transposon TNT 1-94 [Tanacetum coccineum]